MSDGRAYDVAAFRGVRPRGEVLLDQSLAGADSAGELVTGMAKLAQWFALELLTRKGSLPYDPDRGTELMTALVRGRLRTETDLFVAFGFAVGEIAALARRIEVEADPADERFAGAELTRVEIAPGLARLHVRLASRAGASRAILLPISTIR